MNEGRNAAIRIVCMCILGAVVIGLDIYLVSLSQWLYLIIITIAGIFLLELIHSIGKKKT